MGLPTQGHGREQDTMRAPRSSCAQEKYKEQQARACPVPPVKVTSQVGQPTLKKTMGLGNRPMLTPPIHTHNMEDWEESVG